MRGSLLPGALFAICLVGCGAAARNSNQPLLTREPTARRIGARQAPSSTSDQGPTATSVVAGPGTTCAVAFGNVWCWGTDLGSLGSPVGRGSGLAQRVEGVSNVVQLAVGSYQACALKAGGAVVCWGNHGYGHFGSNGHPHVPVSVPLGQPARSVGCGSSHACAVLLDGSVSCWGSNHDGRITGSLQASGIVDEPVRIAGVSRAREVTGGVRHSCALLMDGNVVCWGRNDHGQIDGQPSAARSDAVTVELPDQVVAMASGGLFNCAVTAHQEVYCWGAFGDPDYEPPLNRPSPEARIRKVPLLPPVDRLAVGMGGAACAGRGSSWWCWGDNGTGQLLVHPLWIESPERLPGGFESLALGGTHACGVRGERVYCWGRDSYGSTGRAADLQRNTVPLPSAVAAVGVSPEHVCAVTSDDGALYCWGDNYFGQLGDGSRTDRVEPVRVPLDGVTGVAAGQGHTCALAGSKVYCWGLNSHGQSAPAQQFEAGSPDSVVLQPTEVGSLAGVAEVGAGDFYSCARLRDGRVWCWGAGPAGRRAPDGLDHSRLRVIPRLRASSISVGLGRTCAIDRQGRVWCWGRSLTAQAGTVPDVVDTPRQLMMPAASVVSAADDTICADTENGLYCWYLFPSDRETGTDVLAEPRHMPFDSPAKAIALGVAHVCVIDATDRMRCSGQAGMGLPQPDDAVVRTVAVGGKTTCAVLEEGQLVCWSYALPPITREPNLIRTEEGPCCSAR